MTGTSEFVHLHNHTHYSMLDGHQTVKDMVAEMARLNQRAGAITDHGNEHGFYEFQKEALAVGVEPIFGLEAYAAPINPEGRHVRERIYYGRNTGQDQVEGSDDVSGGGTYTHMTLLAKDNEGLHNLFRLNSLAYIEGYYRKPRIDLELLSRFGKGIVATTGCPSGEIQTRIRLGQYEKAREYASQMQDIVGRENYFLELMDHGMSIDLERKVVEPLLRLAKELNIPLLATNDSHYAREEDHLDHEHMLAMQTGANMSEPSQDNGGKRFAFNGQGYFIKSAEQMAQIFGDQDRFPNAMSNTLLVAEMCTGARMEFDADLRPAIELPEGYTAESYLRKEAYEGLTRRFGTVTKELEDRMETELNVVIPKQYAHYFLVTSDFVRWAKANGVEVGYGRGSAGGSLLAYALDITELDPIRHKLLFERFLNPERDSPPDIDMDFDDRNRDRVIEYVTNKYGKDAVAMISTFTKIGVKTGIKDSARILEKPYGDSDALTKAVPKAVVGHEVSFDDIYNPEAPRYDEAHDFRELVKTLDAQDIIDTARGVEGRVKTTGVHAAGIIISSRSLMDTIPLSMRQKDGAIITQFDYPTCESLGLIKVDFLGLRNLTIIGDAIKNIKFLRNEDVDILDIIHGPMDDPKTIELLQRGDTLGVFQLDGGAMRELLRRMKPTSFDDISAVLALYRPGPMGVNAHNDYADRKNGRQPVVPIHPELEEPLKDILGDTYQLIIFQEQVMQIAAKVAGYSLARADNLRRAMGKKKRSVLDAEYEGFAQGMRDNGYSDDAIDTLWQILVPFADYSFNRSHTAGYGLISYLTAYLKTHYPSEYMSALVTSVFDDKDTTALYLAECRRMGLKVSSPDVNLSQAAAMPVDERTIAFGMAGVRGVSETVSELIIEARGDKPFTSINDFLTRVPSQVLNKRVLEGLIDAGGFDSFGYSRRALLAVLPEAAKSANATKKVEDKGQFSLFDIFDEEEDPIVKLEVNIPDIPEFPKRELLARERAVMGLYVSDHPLSGMETALDASKTNDIAEIKSGVVNIVEGYADRDTPRIQIAGVISSIVEKRTKAGDLFAILTIEDMTGSIEAPLWARTYKQYQGVVKTDHIYTLTGVPRVREEGETPTFSVDSLEEIEVSHDGRVPLWLRLTPNQCTESSLHDLQLVLKRHSGDSPVHLSIREPNKVTAMALPDELAVHPSPLLLSEIKALFGVNSLGKWNTQRR